LYENPPELEDIFEENFMLWVGAQPPPELEKKSTIGGDSITTGEEKWYEPVHPLVSLRNNETL
jgi:hypothetical protein